MADKLNVLTPLLKALTPLLKKQGLQRETGKWDLAIFARKRGKDVQRVGFGIEKSRNKKGEFEFAVLVGVELGDLPLSSRHWVGMPRTHERNGLEYMFTGATRNQIRKKYVCSKDTDWKILAAQFSDWIAVGLDKLEARRDKLRASHVSQIETAGRNQKKRLAIFAERKQKELRKRKPKGKASKDVLVTGTINIFEIAGRLLRAKSNKVEELVCSEFEDEGDAHDETIWRQKQVDIIAEAHAIQAELESVFPPDETGDTEHGAIPVNGVHYYALWQISWKHLFVAVSHEDTELPVYLLLGTTSIPH